VWDVPYCAEKLHTGHTSRQLTCSLPAPTPRPHQVWDVPYWAEKLRASRYNLTDEELRPYLALPNVLAGMFKVGQC
jgi:hypothetical protein